MTSSGNGEYTGAIPAVIGGSEVEYYIEAVDQGGIALMHPRSGGQEPHRYSTGNDDVPPTLDHVFLMDQRLVDWPPVVRARATEQDIVSIPAHQDVGSVTAFQPVVSATCGDEVITRPDVGVIRTYTTTGDVPGDLGCRNGRAGGRE